MNFIQRALYSIKRRPGKSLILLALVFILGNLIAGSVSILNAAESVEAITKKQLGALAVVEIDVDKMLKEGGKELKPLGIDKVAEIGKSEYVEYFDYSLNSTVDSVSIKNYQPENSPYNDPSRDQRFEIIGVQYEKVMNIESGVLKLKEGRTFTKEEIEEGALKGLISKEVAEKNGIKIGDSIAMRMLVDDFLAPQGADSILDQKDYNIEVIGIYEVVDSNKGNGGSQTMEDLMNTEIYNTVYTPNKVPLDMIQFLEETFKNKRPDFDAKQPLFYEPKFMLKSVDDEKAFRAEVEGLISSGYKLKFSTDQYENAANPIRSMKSMARLVLIVSILATLLIVSLVVVLFLRDRKHEFGIYMALGESKTKLLSQVVIEVVLVGMVAMSLALYSGNTLAQGVSQSMIQNQLRDNQNSGSTTPGYSGSQTPMKTLSMEEISEAFSISFNKEYISLYYLIGLGTLVVSTIVPVGMIARLKPKKVLL